MNNGFIFGVKSELSLETPIEVVAYEEQQHSWIRKVKSRYGLIQFAKSYSFIILGKYHEEWFFLDPVE